LKKVQIEIDPTCSEPEVIIRTNEMTDEVQDIVQKLSAVKQEVLVQTAFLALLGFIYGVAMLIWDIDEWSYLKQTGIFFLICSIAVILIGYLMHWIPRSFIGFIVYYAIFIVGFFIIWAINFFIWRAKISKIDDELKKQK
jgi:hypothetical protein